MNYVRKKGMNFTAAREYTCALHRNDEKDLLSMAVDMVAISELDERPLS